MEDVVARFVENLFGRITGPMNVRLILQPLMALIFAARAGLRDAKTGQEPYFWTMFTSKGHRRAMLREGWKDVGKVFVIAVVLDAVYQGIALRWLYPGEAVIVAAMLAFIPYLVFRGAFTRLGRLMGMGGERSAKPGAA